MTIAIKPDDDDTAEALAILRMKPDRGKKKTKATNIGFTQKRVETKTMS